MTASTETNISAGSTPLKRFVADFNQSTIAVASLIVLVALILAAVFAPWLAPQNPYNLGEIYLIDSQLKPGATMFNQSTAWLGTDIQGRDILSGIIYGLRISLSVSLISAFIALVIGACAGLLAGYFGGTLDSILMRLVDIQLSFPAILIGLVLIAILGSGLANIIIALIAVQWAYYARTVRASALAERNKEYMEAARCLAISKSRILFRHLLPNCVPPLIVVVTIQVAHSIALEASLSFLGVGLPITEPSLGRLIASGFEFMLSGKYWMSFYPGIALLITILSINLVGDQLRDVLNPRLQK